MARPVRSEFPGAVYHVITRGHNRQAIFRDDRDRAVRKGSRQPPLEGCYGLGDIVQAVSKVTGVGRDELGTAAKEVRVQRGRELLMYVARRYSRASLAEIASYLRARDISTVSHGVRRAETYLGEDRDFQHQADQVLEKLKRSRIQA